MPTDLSHDKKQNKVIFCAAFKRTTTNSIQPYVIRTLQLNTDITLRCYRNQVVIIFENIAIAQKSMTFLAHL